MKQTDQDRENEKIQLYTELVKKQCSHPEKKGHHTLSCYAGQAAFTRLEALTKSNPTPEITTCRRKIQS